MSTTDNNPSPNNPLQPVASNSSLVTQEVQRANRQLALAGKVGTQLILNDERRRWVALLSRGESKGVVTFLSMRMPLSQDLLAHHEEHWDWDALSQNKSLPWSLELIEKFKDNWNWDYLSLNESVPWSIVLIEHFEDYWTWGNWESDGLSDNKNLPWSLELLERFESRWNWGWFYDSERFYGGISGNESLPWTPKLIERFEHRWDWTCLSSNSSLPWSLELLEHFENHWTWETDRVESSVPCDAYGNPINKYADFISEFSGLGITENESIPWTVELIERFEDHWDWEYFSHREILPWSVELLERFEDRWDWRSLSRNKCLPWSIELIERHKDRWHWSTLSRNEKLPWSVNLIDHYAYEDEYEAHWDWYCMAKNKSIRQSQEFTESVKNYIDYYDWEEWGERVFTSFDYNESNSVPWYTAAIINKQFEHLDTYEDHESWKELSYCDTSWSQELLDRYVDRWDWSSLSHNNYLPWSITLLEAYENRWNWIYIAENTALTTPRLTEQDIEEVMEKITVRNE